MGFFAGLSAEAYDRTYSDRQLAQRMWKYFRPHTHQLILISLAIAINSATGAATPILVSRGVDYLAAADASQWMYFIAGALFLLGILGWISNWIRRRLTVRTIGDVMLTLREDAFRTTIEHDLSFFDEFASGRIISRITSDTQDFAKIVILLSDLFNQVIQAGILLFVLLKIDIHLTLLLLAILPFVFCVALFYRRLARKVIRRGMRVMANVNALIKEAVTGIAVAKNFRQEATIYSEFESVNRQSYQVNLHRGLTMSLIYPMLNALGGIAIAILVYAGGLGAAAGAITAGAWYLFINSLNRFWGPVQYLSAFWSQVQEGLSAAERVFALIDIEQAVIQRAHNHAPKLHGEIAFEHLDFHYLPNEPILHDFNLIVNAGENLALVGHTGAGKSTIARLIARFYEFQVGKLTIDGMDIRTFDLPEYRQQLGIVSQVPFLFSGTVAENIRYASNEISDQQIENLARRIGEGEWLANLPDGLQTQVGERGAQLSMGQRQLVALMRVLVQRPAIFILDEATASIDPFTETQIQEALELILGQTTSILIAHRLSTIKAADRIIVLKQGQIIEVGNHTSLMAQGGHYATLYNTYFRHQSLEYIEKARRAALNE